jgi:hypothetical protein
MKIPIKIPVEKCMLSLCEKYNINVSLLLEDALFTVLKKSFVEVVLSGKTDEDFVMYEIFVDDDDPDFEVWWDIPEEVKPYVFSAINDVLFKYYFLITRSCGL